MSCFTPLLVEEVQILTETDNWPAFLLKICQKEFELSRDCILLSKLTAIFIHPPVHSNSSNLCWHSAKCDTSQSEQKLVTNPTRQYGEKSNTLNRDLMIRVVTSKRVYTRSDQSKIRRHEVSRCVSFISFIFSRWWYLGNVAQNGGSFWRSRNKPKHGKSFIRTSKVWVIPNQHHHQHHLPPPVDLHSWLPCSYLAIRTRLLS